MKVIRDNIHGDIEFYPEEMRLLHTAEFERLHGCRQLGLSHLIYPGAKHSRFEHVLGVMHVANEIAKRMREQGDFFPRDKYGDELLRVLRFSALLHDMGHVPFGHTLEDEMPIIPKHDIPSEEVVALHGDGQGGKKATFSSDSRMEIAVSATLRASGNERFIEPVLQVLRAIASSKDDEKLHGLVERGEIKPDYLVLGDIIGNTICADLLDYIKRDHMMAGIHATYDSRIFRYFGVREHRGYKRAVILLVKTGRVRNDALADLLDILKLRYNLSDKVLFHPKKCAADAMIIKVISEQIKKGLSAENLLDYSDDGLLDHLRDHPLVKMIRSWTLFKPVFVCGLGQINTYDPLRPKKTLIEELHKDAELRSRIEKRIQREVGLSEDRTSVLIFCPRPNMSLKPVRALVQWKDGTIRRLNEIEREDDPLTYDQVALLQAIYPQLWKLYLFVEPNIRNYAETLQVKFCSILKEEAGLSATCDPAFQHYLEKSCIDVKMGRLLDRELGLNAGVGKLAAERKLKVTAKCHERIPADPFSDDYAEQDAQVLATRRDDPALAQRVREILDVVMREESKTKDEIQGQMSLGSERVS